MAGMTMQSQLQLVVIKLLPILCEAPLLHTKRQVRKLKELTLRGLLCYLDDYIMFLNFTLL